MPGPPPPKVYAVEISTENYLDADKHPERIPEDSITYIGRRYARACRDETSIEDLHPFCVFDHLKKGLPVCGTDKQPLCKKYCDAVTDDARAKRLKIAKD